MTGSGGLGAMQRAAIKRAAKQGKAPPSPSEVHAKWARYQESETQKRYKKRSWDGQQQNAGKGKGHCGKDSGKDFGKGDYGKDSGKVDFGKGDYGQDSGKGDYGKDSGTGDYGKDSGKGSNGGSDWMFLKPYCVAKVKWHKAGGNGITPVPPDDWSEAIVQHAERVVTEMLIKLDIPDIEL